MAQPKKKTSHQKQHSRRAHWKALGTTNITKCLQCGEPKKPHNMCQECGYYRGRPAFRSEQII